MARNGTIENYAARKGWDCYNPSVPFAYGKRRLAVARTEPADDEFASRAVFFEERKPCVWEPLKFPEFKLQDPFLFKLGKDFVLGGVRVALSKERKLADYRTVFYKGKNLRALRFWFRGPSRMKGICIVERAGDGFIVLTRPQIVSAEDPFGRGRIGLAFARSLREIPGKIGKAKILSGLCRADEWVGSNQAFELKNGNIGVVGHRARFDKKGHRHYSAIAFEADPLSGKVHYVRALARRGDFPRFEGKRKDLYDVLYPAGIVKNGKGSYELFTGIGDKAIGTKKIDYPFSAPPARA